MKISKNVHNYTVKTSSFEKNDAHPYEEKNINDSLQNIIFVAPVIISNKTKN